MERVKENAMEVVAEKGMAKEKEATPDLTPKDLPDLGRGDAASRDVSKHSEFRER
jgi:hypothetical protein